MSISAFIISVLSVCYHCNLDYEPSHCILSQDIEVYAIHVHVVSVDWRLRYPIVYCHFALDSILSLCMLSLQVRSCATAVSDAVVGLILS